MQKSSLLEYYALSDIGLVRLNNEDAWTTLEQEQFFALADGIGGHQAGDVAAQTTIEHMCSLIEGSLQSLVSEGDPTDQLLCLLKKAIVETNRLIFCLSLENPIYQGMGTTLCCLLFYKNTVLFANVGDSRIYRFRKRIKRLSHDQISINPENGKRLLVQSIGFQGGVNPQFGKVRVQSGDIFFLCSDGLTDTVSDKEIEKILLSTSNLKDSCDQMISLAKENGSSDNITIVMIRT